jgi:hypothetical protein
MFKKIFLVVRSIKNYHRPDLASFGFGKFSMDESDFCNSASGNE